MISVASWVGSVVATGLLLAVAGLVVMTALGLTGPPHWDGGPWLPVSPGGLRR